MRMILWIHVFLCIALCFVYPLLISCSFYLYKALGGVILSRGVGIGMASQSIQIAFGFMSFGLMAVSSAKLRLATAMAFSVAIMFYLYAHHPLRALMFAGLAMGLTLLVELIMSVASRRLSGKES